MDDNHERFGRMGTKARGKIPAGPPEPLVRFKSSFQLQRAAIVTALLDYFLVQLSQQLLLHN